MTKSLCTYPFESFFLNTNGEVKFCCASDLSLGNINEEPLEKILNNQISNEIRSDIFAGRWHEKNCSYCKKIESVGGISQRSIPETQPTGQYNLTNFDVRWTNTCNLSCIYCNSQFSSKWASLRNEQSNLNKEVAEKNVFDFIDFNRERIQKINLLGGEPLLQKQNLQLVDMLPEKEYYILTNLTVDIKTNPVAQKLISNPNVTWGVSFETIGDRFEYVRHGSSWKTFEDNIKYVCDMTGKKINAHPVYFLYSSLRLVEYCDYVLNSEYFESVYWQCLTTPPSLSIFSHHPEIRTMALMQLEECLQKYSGNYNVRALESFRENLLTQSSEIIDKNEYATWLNKMEHKFLCKTTKVADLWPEINAVYGENNV